jgi:hypothetical protein
MALARQQGFKLTRCVHLALELRSIGQLTSSIEYNTLNPSFLHPLDVARPAARTSVPTAPRSLRLPSISAALSRALALRPSTITLTLTRSHPSPSPISSSRDSAC